MTLAVQKGYLSKIAENANDVNAPAKMKHLGIEVESINSNADVDYAELVEVVATCEKGTVHSAAGTVTGKSAKPRIVQVDAHSMEINPCGRCVMVLKNQDTPGMVGIIGTILGNFGCNIANMSLTREEGAGRALSAFELDGIPAGEALADLKALGQIEDVKVVDFA